MKKSLISFLETFVAGFLLSVLIMLFVGQSLEITGDSMYPTLKNNERIIVEKVTYKNRQPNRGEIIVFRSLQNDRIFLIKRVVAVQGDKVSISPYGAVYVQHGPESFLHEAGVVDSLGALEEYSDSPIPTGHVAVMGDNREESYDSRMFGLVPVEKVVGRAFVVYWPIKGIRQINL